MISEFDGYNYIVRLNKGEHLMDCLRQFLRGTDLRGAWLSGVGGVSEVTLGFYDLEAKEYHWKTISQLLEIASLQGNIALNVDGEPVFHVHGVFSDADYQAVGGHVKDMIVSGTCEIFIHRTYKPLRRKHDDEVGLELLDL